MIFITSVLLFAIICFLIWYIRKLLITTYYYQNNMAVLIKHLNEIKEHLEIVLSMEVYTGEPTIENLSKHMKDMVEFCEEYNKVFDFLDSKNEQNQEK